ncbi:MAG: OsmC family protein [Saprospiraceae bacterium]
MITSRVKYLGELRTECVHVYSGNTIITDAPLDNQGKAEAFSPTDLTATSLATCMLTIMGISARNHQWNIDGAEAEVTKIMASNPRRIGQIDVTITLNGKDLDARNREVLETAGRNCPVMFSLHPDIVKEIQFIWE